MRYIETVNPYEAEIRRLQDELSHARYTIISLMPEEIEKILTSYYSCKSRQETYGWADIAATEIIEFAEILSPEEGSYFSERAYCPLCKDGSNSYYERGFSVPEGIRRYLVGYGNTHQCRVFEAAQKLARNHWHDEFSAAEKAEAIEKQKRIIQRKKTEILYKIAPIREPELIDEGIGFGTAPRSDDEMAWAENRLVDLGFQISCEANIKSYIKEQESLIVYADPRAKGEIKFTVYKKPLSKSNRKRYWNNSFSLKDNWKNDIRGKYESRVAQAIQ
jgi:hypothetical protein